EKGLELSPSGVDIHFDLAILAAVEGDERRAESASRQWATLAPSLASSELHAFVMLGLGRSIGAVRETLRRGREQFSEGGRQFVRASHEAQLAALSGDLDAVGGILVE